MNDTHIIVLEDNKWYTKVLAFGYLYQKFDGEYFTSNDGKRTRINPNYDIYIYTNSQFNDKYTGFLISGRKSLIASYSTSEYYRLSADDNNTTPNNGYISGNALATSAKLMLKEKPIFEVVEDMAKTFQTRQNKKTNSTKYIQTFVDYQDYMSRYIIRSAINELLRAKHKLKFNGTSVERLIKKPKQKEQTPVDLQREEIFYKLFDEGNIRSVDLTKLAIKSLVKAIALTIDIPSNKFNASVVKQTILTKCYNEVLYAKMCGANDLCEAINDYRYSPSNYIDIGRYAISKQTFIKNCKNQNSGEIFDELIRKIDHTCSKTTHVKNITRHIAEVFETFNTEKKIKND